MTAESKAKKQRAALIAAAVIFIVSAVWCGYLLFRQSGRHVEIISDGRVLYTLDLDREADREITVEYEGRKNVIAIKDHDIFMKEAECPDHTCIKTGRLGSAGVPIVCLPNKLMIRFKAGTDTAENGGVDAAA